MEAGKVLETLEGDCVGLQMGESQRLKDETLEQQISVLTSLGVKCAGSEKDNVNDLGVNNDSLESVLNPEKESGFGFWNHGFASTRGNVVMESREGDGGGVSLMETGYDGNESEQVGAKDVMRKIDSQSGNKASKEGISLIVEVFGPLNGISQVDNAFCESEHEGARNGGIEEVANPSDSQEHEFCVGDLVWAKTKTQLWWPGKICDPTAAMLDQTEAGFLVKYFGSIISVRCSSPQLKPFHEYFEQMSQQNKSRTFLGAVERALLEIGQRIRREMSCSCSSKEKEAKNTTQVPPVSKDNRGELGFFSPSIFEPEKFLESIRYQAVDMSRPGSIEFTVTKNCLLAFYSSVGHKQLPMHKLRPRNEGDDAKEGALRSSRSERKGENADKISKGKHEKSFELRERKKSKYLSYPYVTETEDLKGGSCAGVDAKNVSEQSTGGGATPSGNSSGKNPRKKSRKSRTFKSIYGKVESVDTSTTEMLRELQLTALDCLRSCESKDSISAMNFFYNFRKHSFLNHDFTGEDNTQQQQKTEELTNKEASGHQEIGVGSEGEKLQLAPSSVVPKRKRRKPKEVVNQNSPQNVSLLTGEQNKVEGGKVRRKRKKMETTPENGVIGGLPDLNGNTMSLSVENMEVTGPDTSKGKLEPKRAKNKELFVSEPSAGTPSSITNGTNFIPALNDVRVENNVPLTGLSFTLTPEHKSRKRKEKAPDFENNSTSAIPDLNGNGNGTDPNSTGKGLADSSGVTSQDKPQRKRRRRTKSDAGRSTLLLNFTPGHPLPSKESLNATFIRFGPVVELGTQHTGDSSAQVVFAQTRDAQGAYQSLEKSSPFGAALASYHLNSPPVSTGKGLADSSAKPQRRRRRRKITGNILVLNFTPGHPLPSKESLNDTFVKFGPVLEPETKFLSDSSAQIVFAESRDAELAHESLEKSSPFGPTLAGFRLHCPPAVSNSSKMPSAFLRRPVDPLKVPGPPPLSGITPPNGEAPDLMYMKQNLEMMTAMLEKAGDDISPEMKAKLESEVKGFLKKISSMVGGSSS